MSAPSLTLWTLDHHLSASDFERLCVDLLIRDGYWRILPIGGTKDHGRDAEGRYWHGKSPEQSVVVFQFSTEQNWEKKLRRDAEKIAAHCPDATAMVFVTSRTVTGEKRDKLSTEFGAQRGWHLAIYDREWLRVRLEEFHPDLARKYLHVDLPNTVSSVASQIRHFALDGPSAKELFRNQSPEQVRTAILESTRREPTVPGHWKSLARIEDYLENFQAALEAVNQALELETDPLERLNLRQMKAAALAERGIQTESKPLLIQAKEFFEEMVTKVHRAQDHYNLANVLSPLHDWAGAEEHYQRSLELDPNYAQAWKNLGTLYLHRDEYEKGMECFDKALQLEPALVEAHLSKGSAWLMFFNEPQKAVACFEAAYALEPELDRRWRHTRGWLSRALTGADRLEPALREAEIGLQRHPDDKYLLNQKAVILSSLWPRDPAYVQRAYDFFVFRAQCVRFDYGGLAELIKLCRVRGDAAAAWPWVELNLESSAHSLQRLLAAAGQTVDDLEVGLEAGRLFEHFREGKRVTDYGYLLFQHGLTPNPAMLAALNFCTLASFGWLERQLRELAKLPSGKVPAELRDKVLEHVSQIYAGFGADWLTGEKPATREEQTRLLSIGILQMPEVVIAEASRMIGYLGGRHNLTVTGWGETKADWRDFMADTGVRLMETVLEQWQMLPPATPPQA